MVSVGSLVRPISKQLLLTPESTTVDIEDVENWLNWIPTEVGIVLSIDTSLGIKILIPSGIGYCFFDEIKKIN